MKKCNTTFLSLMIGISPVCSIEVIKDSAIFQPEKIQNSSIEFSTKEQIQYVIQKAYEGKKEYRNFIINRFYMGHLEPKWLNIDIQKLFDKNKININQLTPSEIYTIYKYDTENMFGLDKEVLFKYVQEKALEKNPIWQNLIAFFLELKAEKIENNSSLLQQAFEWYKLAANQGDAMAQINLGYNYKNGYGVKQDYAEAAEWYRKAAEQGNSSAQYNLGLMYKNGYSVKQDYNEAVKWYTKAAVQGEPYAQYELGIMYQDGLGVKQDYNETVIWFTKAAVQGNSSAQNSLAFMYDNGHCVIKNEKIAFEWYTKAAEQGHSEAQYNVGAMYHNGQGVKKDYKEAVKWYTKAAVQGEPYAQYELGIMYQDGLGVKKDYTKAAEWYTKAAVQEDPDAQFRLGIMYQEGLGVKKNYNKAVEWYTKAADQGHEKARFSLFYLSKEGHCIKPEYEKKAAEWFNDIDLLAQHYYMNSPDLPTLDKVDQKDLPKKTTDQEILEKAKYLFDNRNRLQAFAEYLEAEKLGNEKAKEFLKHYHAGPCKNKQPKHTILHTQFNKALEDFNRKYEAQQVKETVSNKKRKKKKKRNKNQKASVVKQNEVIQPSVDTKQEENLTPQVVQPPLESQQVIVPATEPTPAPQPVIPIIEMQPVLVLPISKEPPVKEEIQEELKHELRRKPPLSRTLSLRELGEKNHKQENEKKKQSKTLQRRNTVRDLTSTDSELKDKKPGKHPSLSRTQSHSSLQRRNSTSAMTSTASEQKTGDLPPLSYKRLSRKLSEKDLRTIEDIQLDKPMIMDTLNGLQERGLIKWRKSKKRNTIKATTTIKGVEPQALTLHLHDDKDRPWGSKPETTKGFLKFVGFCDPELAKWIENIGQKNQNPS